MLRGGSLTNTTTMTNTVPRGTVHENLSAGSREECKDPIMPNMSELQELKHLKKENLTTQVTKSKASVVCTYPT